MESCNPTRIQGDLETRHVYREDRRSLTYTGGSGNDCLIQGDLSTRQLYRGTDDPTLKQGRQTFPFINVQAGAITEADIP